MSVFLLILFFKYTSIFESFTTDTNRCPSDGIIRCPNSHRNKKLKELMCTSLYMKCQDEKNRDFDKDLKSKIKLKKSFINL